MLPAVQTLGLIRSNFHQGTVLGFLLALSLLFSLIYTLSAVASLPLLLAVYILSQYESLIPRGAVEWVFHLMLVWLPISLVLSVSPGLSINYIGVVLVMPLAFLLGRRLLATQTAREGLTKPLWFLLCSMSVWGVLQDPAPFHDPKAQGPFGDPNLFAGFLNLLFLPLLFNYMRADLRSMRNLYRVGQLAILATTLLASFMISSRGAMLSMLLLVPLILWQSRDGPSVARKYILLGFLTLIAYALAYWVKQGAGTLITRFAYTLNKGDDSRWMLIQSTWEMIRDHPLLGTGLGTYRIFYPIHRNIYELSTSGAWAHNDYLQYWQEGGLPLFAVLAMMTLWLLRFTWRCIRTNTKSSENDMVGFACGILAVCVQANVNFIFYATPVLLVVGIYMAAINATAQNPIPATVHRFQRPASLIYIAIMVWLMGMASVTTIVFDSRVQQLLAKKWGDFSRYDTALILSSVTHNYPPLNHILGEELLNAALSFKKRPSAEGNTADQLAQAAIEELSTASRAVPCYVPFAMDVVRAMFSFARTPAQFDQVRPLLHENLLCNPRHGLTYYFAGLVHLESGHPGLANDVWLRGQEAANYHTERLMLLAASLSLADNERALELRQIAKEMAEIIGKQESNPLSKLDTGYWFSMQDRLNSIYPKEMERIWIITKSRNRAE
jgi:O-antigen ligase